MHKCIDYALRSKSFCLHWHCLVIDENVIRISTPSIQFVHDCMSYKQRHTSEVHHMAWFRMRRPAKLVNESGMLVIKYAVSAKTTRHYFGCNIYDIQWARQLELMQFPVRSISWWITVGEILRQHIFYLCLKFWSYDLIQCTEDGALIPNHAHHMHIQIFADW